GHVDGVGEIVRVEPVGDARRVVVRAPQRLARYLADKGSVTVDGVSLTINRLVEDAGFELMLVPHTLAVTTLGELGPRRRVNIEVDVLARYVVRQLDRAGITRPDDASLMETLKHSGYLD